MLRKEKALPCKSTEGPPLISYVIKLKARTHHKLHMLRNQPHMHHKPLHMHRMLLHMHRMLLHMHRMLLHKLRKQLHKRHRLLHKLRIEQHIVGGGLALL
ncbi:hypothetical protein ACR9YC_08470 [Parasphingorhabdus sp. DH2-15]|uniref:hypothetical protein n=1 Tax=Parasphingorhabdus sp. DH2-15 TaxID=3444112 RepID=UPI003F688203